MKCEIYCPKCFALAKQKWLKPVQVMVEIPGRSGPGSQLMMTPVESIDEHWKAVTGQSTCNGYCDFCNEPFKPGDEIAAVSMYRGDAYRPWESMYVSTNNHSSL